MNYNMTLNDNNNYCVILAGGKGRRLWPCSRSSHPKQFIDFFGVGRTQLQQTFDRMAKIVPADHIYINTNEEYVELVKEQLPEVPADRIMAEPIHRNTAPSMAWANHRISMLNPDACIIILLPIRPSSMKRLSARMYWRAWRLLQLTTVS